MSEGNIAIRLKGFMESQGLTYSQFADTCGIPRPSLSQILNGRNKKISDIILTQIHEAFPQLSISWLLFGEGGMFSSEPQAFASNMDNDEIKDIPINLSDNLFDAPDFSTDDVVKAMPQRDANVAEKSQPKGKPSTPPRKVVSITVFYDDNSYEVFTPAKK